MCVSSGRIVLDQVPGQGDDVGLPIACLVMGDDFLQRRIGYGASQVAIPVGKQMRVRQMQDPRGFS